MSRRDLAGEPTGDGLSFTVVNPPPASPQPPLPARPASCPEGRILDMMCADAIRGASPISSLNRRGMLTGSVATLLLTVAPAAGPAKAAELDGELLALLGEGRAALAAWQAAPVPISPFGAPTPWDALLTAAAQLPARTPEGLRAKAEATADWLAGGDRRSGLPHWCRSGEEQVGWSLLRDLLPELPEARPSPHPEPLPAGRPCPDTELVMLCRGHAALLDAANDQTTSDAENAVAVEAYERSCDAICAAMPSTIPGMIAMARAAMAEARNLDGTHDLNNTLGATWALSVLRALVTLGGGEAAGGDA